VIDTTVRSESFSLSMHLFILLLLNHSPSLCTESFSLAMHLFI
jgi:hypothetical protein